MKQKTAARAKVEPAPAGLHAMIAVEGFAIQFRGVLLSFKRMQRYVVEPALKALIQSTDRRVMWES